MLRRAPLVAALWPALALAQAPPDAGTSLRERQQPPLALPASRADPLPRIPEVNERAAAASEMRIAVESFHVHGNTVFDNETLLGLLMDLRGRDLQLDELAAAADRITAYYRERSYLLSRAYLPAQEIVEGKVTLAVLEGRYGAVNVQNESRVRDEVLDAWLRKVQQGDLVEARSLERRLLPVDDMPGVRLATRLSPGTNVGESDLTVYAIDEPRVSGALGMDNHGNRHTGEHLLSGQLSVASPLGLGDELSLSLLYSDEDQLYYQARFSTPLRADANTRFGVSASRMDYELAGDFSALEANGTADSFGVHVSHGWIRSRAFNLRTGLALEQRDLEDRLWDGLIVTRKRSRNLELALSGDWHGAASANAFSLRWVGGDLAPHSTELAEGVPQGHFDKLHAAWMRLQRLSERVSLYTTLQGQLAGVDLDSSEKIVLGGVDGVRAYPVGEASADEALLASVEVRLQAGSTWQLKLFADAGWARLQNTPAAGDDNHRSLSGIGAGVNWQPTAGLTFAVAAAVRTGESALSDRDERVRTWGQMRWGF